ncbi:hypothetical protein [Winogradskyella psychrotolerans]|uniref:hypothetical protein n=1 Tax=Winogradskyella psychrotolerans TaxID=1344585 RepID=UPI001C07EECB|nr:hypothetical protein [Winogradskyella psychrotolerans]MBU2929240.1 hypothetical protein [Winogradskyella psychrotolerans]
MILISKYIVPKGYLGITIFPFMFLRSKDLKGNSVLVNHEGIHLRQQLELLIIPFYIIYAFEFLYRLFQYRNWKLAYMNISFEREAYKNEKDLDYLKSRSLWQFISYINR